MVREELLDLNDVCPNAPEWARGRHHVLGWQDYDDEATYQWCGFKCGWTRTLPPPKKKRLIPYFPWEIDDE
jgi:hypothetical protein